MTAGGRLGKLTPVSPPEPHVRIINIHEAKTHLSKLIDQAVKGESFVIAKSGNPLVTVTRITRRAGPRRVGFLADFIKVPADFDPMGRQEIEQLFTGQK